MIADKLGDAQQLHAEREGILEAVRLGAISRAEGATRLASNDERGELLAAELGPGWRWYGGLVYSAEWL